MPRRSRKENSPSVELRIVSADDPEAWPLLVAFDLEQLYLVGSMDRPYDETHVTPPLKRPSMGINRLVDRRGQELSFYREVPGILAELKRRTIHVAACSRTSAPDLAREALNLLLIPDEDGAGPVKAVTYFNTMEIYPGSKLRHFERLHRKTGIPYDQMLFFDDEHRNFEVESAGVTMQLVPPAGTNQRLFQAGLALWRKRRGIRISKE